MSLGDREDSDKYIGTKENWDKAEKAILEAVEEKDLNVVIEHGEAAFYGRSECSSAPLLWPFSMIY